MYFLQTWKWPHHQTEGWMIAYVEMAVHIVNIANRLQWAELLRVVSRLFLGVFEKLKKLSEGHQIHFILRTKTLQVLLFLYTKNSHCRHPHLHAQCMLKHANMYMPQATSFREQTLCLNYKLKVSVVIDTWRTSSIGFFHNPSWYKFKSLCKGHSHRAWISYMMSSDLQHLVILWLSGEQVHYHLTGNRSDSFFFSSKCPFL